MYNEKALSAIREALAASRQKAIAGAEARKEALYAREPEFYRLDSQVAQTGAEIALAAFDPQAPVRLAELRKRLEGLQDRRRELLASLGYPEDYLLPRFSCPKCQDTGFVAGRRCACFRRRLQSMGAGSLPQIPSQSFEDFDLSFYPAQAEKGGVPPRQQMSNILERIKTYAENFGPGSESLLFIGKTGLGKTHLSLAAGSVVASRGYWVEYASAQAMTDRFERVRFDRGATPEDRDFAKGVLQCDLFILDDLGSEFITSFSQSVLYHVLNERLMAGRATIISTNLDPTQLNGAYSERIASRILCGCTAYAFTGRDIRLEKRLRHRLAQQS